MNQYDYTLDPNKPLTSYGWEQQPTILQDYFATINGYKPFSGHLQNPDSFNLDQLKDKYEQILSPSELGQSGDFLEMQWDLVPFYG